MNEYINGFVGFYDGLAIYMDKYMTRPQSDRTHASILSLAGDYYEEYQGIIEKNGGNEFLKKANQMLLDIQAAVENYDHDRLKDLRHEIEVFIQSERAKQEYADKFSEIFQTDVQQMKLQEEKIKSCQALVDMDIKIHGEISEMTKEVLQVQHVELVDGVVIEKQEKAVQTIEKGLYSSELDDIAAFLKQHKEKLDSLEKEAGKKTLIVNAFAGPGAGKTTACLETVAELKKKGYVAEYVSEYAKELVYDNLAFLDGSKEHQLHILEEQLKRLDRFVGKVDIIVTDAPVLLNLVYLAKPDQEYTEAIKELYGQYESFNFFVHRGDSFVQEGRKENREESLEKDQQIRDILDENDMFYGNFNHKTVDKLADKIEITYKRINAQRNEKNRNTLPVNNEQREESYQAYAYLKKTANAKVIYGSSPEALLARLQGWNRSRTEEMKFHSCYIQKLNPETNRYENPARYEVETGKDITPIYLSIPHMEKNEFKKTTEKLKEAGAKYNWTKKAFYVTKGYNDLNLFAEYLPIAGTYAAETNNRSRHELAFSMDVKENNTMEVKVEGKAPFTVNGDSYNMDFKAIQEDSLKEFVEKFILPDKELLPEIEQPDKKIFEFQGKFYDDKQYAAIQTAASRGIEAEKLQLLCDPKFSSGQMHEIRYAIQAGLTTDQIKQFAIPEYDIWQMDLCRYGMGKGLTHAELKSFIEVDPADKDVKIVWADKRRELDGYIKEQKQLKDPYSAHRGTKNDKDHKESVRSKLEANKGKIEAYSGRNEPERVNQMAR